MRDCGLPPPAPVGIAPVTVDADPTGITVTADVNLLANGSFPIFIDPPFNKKSVHWAYASSNNENNNADHARVGKMPDNAQARYRSYWSFPTTGLPNTEILSAQVKAKLYHSSSCADTPVYAYSTSSITVGNTGRMDWATRPLPNGNYAGSWSGSANKGSCPQPDADAVFDDAQMLTEVQATADAGWSVFVIGLCACDSAGNGESDSARWKKFYVDQTFLIAQFDIPPYKPSGSSFSQYDCYKVCSPAATAVVRTTTPTLRMSAKDPYGGTLVTCFEVRTAASDTATVVVTNSEARNTVSTPQVTVKDTSPAAETKVEIPAGRLSNGSTYYWRATTYDENSFWSGWSPWYLFTVDTTSPAIPTVSSSDYPYKTWAKGVDQAGAFTFTGDAQVQDFTYSFDGGNSTTVPASGTTTKTATVNHAPATDMVHTVTVTAKDPAGNLSPTSATYQFWVATSTAKFAHWTLDGSGADAGSGGGVGVTTPVTLSTAGAGFAAPGKIGTQHATFTGGHAITGKPVLETTKSFTVTAFAKLTSTTGVDQTVLSQAGANVSHFRLHYRKDINNNAGGWCFTMRGSDSAAAASATACTIAAPVLNTWTHLAGVYDQPNGKVRIYLMGGSGTEQCFAGEEREVPSVGSWQGNGVDGFVIGRSNNGSGGTAADHFNGGVDDVWAFQKVQDAEAICTLANQ